MDLDLSRRPAADEHAPYFARYLALVADGDVLATLERQARETRALLGGLDETRAGHRYAPDKWSVREVLGHVIDTERVFAYRALSFARGSEVELPGFDEDAFARAAQHERVPLTALLDDYACVRAASLALLRRLDVTAFERRGVANGKEISVRALAWLMAGHELHHQGVLRERYL